MPSIKITTASLNEEAKNELINNIVKSVQLATQVPKEFIHIIIDIVGDDNYTVGGQTVTEIKKKLIK
ncbi:tautomerase family protein [Fulvivirga sediminis]|uniref:Tautomerase family protein n=1 Tax=Fulvivirga sediminis TaxID=2803949 RepID=A0A937FAX6_9BACT|nr:tautomerase family protein [Fulvivirga sediminis]MBL3657238.1 tautomerase family protein [Fulvivirga sediminis]